jgi:hypothetical protein
VLVESWWLPEQGKVTARQSLTLPRNDDTGLFVPTALGYIRLIKDPGKKRAGSKEPLSQGARPSSGRRGYGNADEERILRHPARC